MSKSPDSLRARIRDIAQYASGRSGHLQQGELQSQREASTAQNSLQTEDIHAQGTEHEPLPHLATVRLARDLLSSLPTPPAPRQETTAGFTSAQPANYRAECEDIIRALRKPTSGKVQSPLLALQRQLVDFFQHGPERATGIFVSIFAVAESGQTSTLVPDGDVDLSWKSCRATATLVGLLACPPARLIEVTKFLSYASNGLQLTLDEIRNTPSDSLQTAFRDAKALARGEKGTTTVISVSLADICHFELGALGESGDFTSFAHAFVIGIGPEGVVVWQSWGEHGYPFERWINHGSARLQNWQEAGDFVDVFETFAAYKGKWDNKRNKLYKKLFNIDIFQICGTEGPAEPIVPRVDPWVRLLVMEDVKLDDLYKFTFE